MGVVEPARREGFAGVKLEEVDALAYVGVGLGPVLADLEGEPGAELEVAGSRIRAAARRRSSTRAWTSVRDQVAKAFWAASMAGCVCSGPAAWWSPMSCAGRAGLVERILPAVWRLLAANDERVLLAKRVADEGEGFVHLALDVVRW